MATLNRVQTINEITTKIHDYVVTQFLLSSDPAALSDDDLLFEGGIIDSAGAVTLVFHLEETFDIRISEEELFPENFATVEQIAGYIARKCAEKFHLPGKGSAAL